MKLKTADIISGLLILLWVYTVVSKLAHPAQFNLALRESPLVPKATISFLAYAVPLAELGLAALLFFPSLRRVGLVGSLVLLTFFTLYIGWFLLSGSKRPCGCGGVLKAMTWPQHFFFNLFFTTITAIALISTQARHNFLVAISRRIRKHPPNIAFDNLKINQS